MLSRQRTLIIAEAGVNHNGSLEMAIKLIDAAKDAGADAVKFQTFSAEKIVTNKASKAEYQSRLTDTNESQYDMLKKLELSEADHKVLVDYCKEKKIMFISTPFDLESADLLIHKMKVPIMKIPSGEITNAPLILHIARQKTPVILSTGMSMLGDIELALGILAFGYLDLKQKPSIKLFMDAYNSEEGQRILRDKVSLLHCTTEYPAPFNEVNLRAMDTLLQAFSLPIGYSDHTEGIAISIAAVARGAKIIEKHFTLDKSLPGPDHRASIEPDELNALIKSIREVELAIGTSNKLRSLSESKNVSIVRKSLVAAHAIKGGEVFTPESISVKRAGEGISPIYYWDYLGKKATKNYIEDQVIEP